MTNRGLSCKRGARWSMLKGSLKKEKRHRRSEQSRSKIASCVWNAQLAVEQTTLVSLSIGWIGQKKSELFVYDSTGLPEKE